MHLNLISFTYNNLRVYWSNQVYLRVLCFNSKLFVQHTKNRIWNSINIFTQSNSKLKTDSLATHVNSNALQKHCESGTNPSFLVNWLFEDNANKFSKLLHVRNNRFIPSDPVRFICGYILIILALNL